MPYGNPIIHGDNVRSVAAQERPTSPAKRYQNATANTARGRNRAEANTPRLKRICHNPGSIQTASGAALMSTAVSRTSGDPRRHELLDRVKYHFLCEARVDRSRSDHHFESDEAYRNRGCRDPEDQIGNDVVRSRREKSPLHCGSRDSHEAGHRDCDRPVTAELRGTHDLPTNRRDLGQCFIQIFHCYAISRKPLR